MKPIFQHLVLLIVICTISCSEGNNNLLDLKNKKWIPKWVDESGLLIKHANDLDLNIFHCKIKYNKDEYYSFQTAALKNQTTISENNREELLRKYFKNKKNPVLAEGHVLFFDDVDFVVEVYTSINSQGKSRYAELLKNQNE